MKAVKKAVIDYFLSQNSESEFEELLRQYGASYEGDSRADIEEEFVADALGGMFTTEDGVQDFLNWLQNESGYNKAEKKTILQRITEWLGDIIEAIRDVMNSGELNGAGVFFAQEQSEALSDIRKQFLEALDGYAENYRKGGAVEGDVKNSFAGIKAETKNFSLLEQAQRLEDIGKATSEEIRQQTGWYRGYDGKWRFEISDRDMKVDTTGKFHSNPDVRRFLELFDKAFVNMDASETELEELRSLDTALKGVNMNPRTLGELIKHDKLFAAYPQLKDITVHFADIDEMGAYDPISKMIGLQSRLKLNKSRLEKTLIHEIQHAIQDIEGFAGGSSPDMWQVGGVSREAAYDYYDRTAGEIEARDSTARLNYDADQRKNTRPDIDRKDVVFSDGGVSYDLDENLAKQIYDWQQGLGKAYGSYNGSYFKLGTTPQIFVKHGAKSKELIMYDEVITKVTGGKHSISTDEIAKLPSQLNDPILLFKGSVQNSFVALTEIIDKQGNDVIVAVHINKYRERTVVNKIASMYSKSDEFGNNKIIAYVLNQINEGNLLDASIKKASNWFTAKGLQLPKAVQTILDANNSIPDSTENVKNSLSVNLDKSAELSKLEEEKRKYDNEIFSLRRDFDKLKRTDEYERLETAVVEAQGKSEEFNAAIDEYNKWLKESGMGEINRKLTEAKAKQSELHKEITRMQNDLHKDFMKSIESFDDETVSKYVSKAVRKFKTTSRFDLAGYLTTTGSLLDFSEGQGYRVQDHREVKDVLDMPDYAEYSDGMIAFMNMGNIRLQSYGIDISKMPNSKQISVLRRFFNSLNGEVVVDFSQPDGHSAGSIEYPENTKADRILNDIKKYFDTGVVPELSDVQRFRYSKKVDISNKRLTNGTETAYNNDNEYLTMANRAKPNARSSVNWVYQQELFSFKENKLFFEKISEINQGSGAFIQNLDGEYMLPIGNKIVFTNGDYDAPYISRVIEVMSDYTTDFEDVRRRVFNYETRLHTGYGEEARIYKNMYGYGYIYEYNSGFNGAYEMGDGKRKRKNRKSIIENYFKSQNRGRNAGNGNKELRSGSDEKRVKYSLPLSNLNDLHRSNIEKVTELSRVAAQLTAHINYIGSSQTKRTLSTLNIQAVARELKKEYQSKAQGSFL